MLEGCYSSPILSSCGLLSRYVECELLSRASDAPLQPPLKISAGSHARERMDVGHLQYEWGSETAEVIGTSDLVSISRYTYIYISMALDRSVARNLLKNGRFSQFYSENCPRKRDNILCTVSIFYAF